MRYSGTDTNLLEGLLLLARKSDRERENFIKPIRTDVSRAADFSNGSEAISNAVVGIDPTVRTWVANLLGPPIVGEAPGVSTLARARLLALMALESQDPRELLQIILATDDKSYLRTLGQGLAAAVNRLAEQPAAALASQLASDIQSSKNSDQIAALSQALANAASKMQPGLAATLVDGLTESIQRAKSSVNDQSRAARLAALGAGLKAAAARLEAPAVAELANKVVNAIQSRNDSRQTALLSVGLATAAASLGSEAAATFADKMVRGILSTSDAALLDVLGSSLKSAARKLDPNAAAALSRQLTTDIENTSDSRRLLALGSGLTAALEKLGADDAATQATALLRSIQGTGNDDQISALWPAFTVAVAQMKAVAPSAFSDVLLREFAANQASLVANLNQALESTPIQPVNVRTKYLSDKADSVISRSESRFEVLGGALAAVADKLSGKDAATLTLRILEITQRPDGLRRLRANEIIALAERDTDDVVGSPAQLRAVLDEPRLSALYAALTKAASRIDASAAPRLAGKIIQAIRDRRGKDSSDDLTSAFAALAGKIDADASRTLTDQLINTIKGTNEPGDLTALGPVLAALAGGLDANSAAGVATTLSDTIQATDDADRIASLTEGLTAVTGRVDASAIREVSNKLVQAALSRGQSKAAAPEVSFQDFAPGKQKFNAVARNKVDRNTTLGDAIVAALTKTNNPSNDLSALRSLAKVLPTGPAAELIEQLAQAALKNNDPSTFSTLTSTLSLAASRLDAADAARMSDTIIQLALKAKSSFQQAALGRLLQEAAAKLDAATVLPVIRSLRNAIVEAPDASRLAMLLKASEAPLGKVEMDQVSARQWIEFCKYPFAPRSAIVDAVHRVNPDSPKKELGFWVFIDWAKGKYHLDLTTPITGH